MANKFRSLDLASCEAPSTKSGDLPWENPGIQPPSGAIPQTPGEKESNTTGEHRIDKAAPKLKAGSGYC